MGVNSGDPEGWAVPAPLVAPVVRKDGTVFLMILTCKHLAWVIFVY